MYIVQKNMYIYVNRLLCIIVAVLLGNIVIFFICCLRTSKKDGTLIFSNIHHSFNGAIC